MKSGRAEQRADASATLQRGFDKNNSTPDGTEAQLAGARGDWKTSVKLGEQAYRENPNIFIEFNLATAYQRIGRDDLARPLYVDLVTRGQYRDMTTIQNFDGSWPSRMDETVSQEASRRLGNMGTPDTVVLPKPGPYPMVTGQ